MLSDVVVIGGGLAGLTCCSYLSQSGLKVDLVEKSALGGRARTFEKEGYKFNLGAHALYSGGYADNILRDLGISWNGSQPKLEGYLLEGEETLPLPSTPSSLMKSKYFSWSEKWEIMHNLYTLSRFRDDASPDFSVKTWMDKNLSSVKVRKYFATLFRLTSYQKELDKLSFKIIIRQFQLATKNGVFYLDNGWQTIVDGLYRYIAKRNVAIHEENVSKISFVDSVWKVETKNNIFSAPTIVLAIPPKNVYQLIPHEKLISCKDAEAVTAACLDLALSELPCPKNILCLGLDKEIYYSVHSQYADIAPQGALIHLIYYLASGESGAEKRSVLENVMDKMQPLWRNYLVKSQFLPNIAVAHSYTNVGGRICSPEVEPGSLYVAGDWVGSHGVLADAAMHTGYQAAVSITQHKKALQLTKISG